MPEIGPILPLPPSEQNSANVSSVKGVGPSLAYYARKVGSAVKDFITTPVLLGGSNCNPLSNTRPILWGNRNINFLSHSTEQPDSILREIDHAANEGLQSAAIRGAVGTDIAGQLHAEFNSRLEIATDKEAPPAVIEVGPPAKNISDPEITRAPRLREQIHAINWKAKTEENCEALCREVSALTVLGQMRKLAGITEKHNVALQRMAGQATKPGETRSLWKIFAEHYNLSLWQKFCAGFAYWFYYKTSLITNTVNAYIEAFIGRLQEDLTAPDNRLKFIRTLLEQTNEFLVEDRRATEAFARAKKPGQGDLKDFRMRAIHSYYGGDLKKLCQAFSKKRVEEDAPTVRFFRKFQKIPGLGWISQLLEWTINRFVIQKIMKSLILPSTLESAIKDGVEATEPDNIAFSLAVTRFINSQLERLRTKLEDTTNPASQPQVLPGTELLPTVINHLMLVLDLEPLKTQPQLRSKLKEIEEKPGLVDKMVEDSLQAGIITGGHYLLEYLDQSAKSQELFASMMELARAPFSSQYKDQAMLIAEFEVEKEKLKRTARQIAKRIIYNEVAKLVGGTPSGEILETTKKVFADGQRVLTRTLEELHKQCVEMVKKVESEEQNSTDQNTVKNELASSLQLLQVLATRSELQDPINLLPNAEKEMVWRSLNPLLQKASQIQENLLTLQQQQDDYSNHRAVSSHFQTIHQHTAYLLDQLTTRPSHFSNQLTRTLQELANQIEHFLKPRAPAVVRLKTHIEQISTLSKSIAHEQQVLHALFTLCPFSENPTDPQPKQKGFLQQLLDYETRVHPPGFQPRACREEMKRQLAFFTNTAQKEGEELRTLLDSNGSLTEKREQLMALLQRIWERHTALRNRDVDELKRELETTTEWAEDKANKFRQVKDEDHAEMQGLVTTIEADAALLYRDAKKMQLTLPFSLTAGEVPFTSMQKKTLVGGLLGATAAGGLSAGLSAVGSLLGGKLGGKIGKAFGDGISTAGFMGAPNAVGLLAKKPAAIAWTVVSFCGGAALSWYAPGLSTAVGVGSMAWTGFRWKQITHTNAQEKVLPRVTNAFDRAVEFIFSSRIYKALATRTIKTAVDAKQ